MKNKAVQLESDTNEKLDDISSSRREARNLAWRKKDIVAELINALYKKEIK